MLNRSTPPASNLPALTEAAKTPTRPLLESVQLGYSYMGPDEFLLKPVRRAIRAKIAIAMIGCGRSHFFALQNAKDSAFDPSFPRSFKLGKSSRSPTVWYADEIEAWLDARVAASRQAH